MTCIAYKNGVIAYDSQITNGDTITYDDYEKCHEVKGIKFVMAGYVCDYQKLIGAWFGEPVTSTCECSAMVFDGETLCYAAYSEKDGLCKTPIWLDRPYVMGGGSAYAMSAMDMGANAYKAVEMAAKRDTSTGGNIRTLTITKPIE